MDIETVRKFHVMVTPTVMLISSTAIESVALGTTSESKLINLLD